MNKSFKEIATEVAEIVEAKSKSYGKSFEKSGDILRILYPNGVKPEEYTDMLAIVRVIDKLFRIANDKGAFGENPWKDVLGYALNAVTRDTPLVSKYIVKVKAKCTPSSPGGYLSGYDGNTFNFYARLPIDAQKLTQEQINELKVKFGSGYDFEVLPTTPIT